MMKNVLIALLILVVAGTMRLANLGTWSFDHDELFTTLEANILFGRAEVPKSFLQDEAVKPEDLQLVRLPKMLPLTYATHRLGYHLFGEDEFGSRVLPAVFGTLSVGAVLLLAVPLFGMPGALTLTFLVMLWPTHLFQSQQNRFYIETFFFVSITFLLAANAVKRRSALSGLLVGLAACAMILCHALTGLIWGIVLAGIVAAWVAERRLPPLGLSAMLVGFSLLFVSVAVFYLVPLATGWNDSAAWGYSPLHAVLATVNMLGFPIALLAGLGGLFAVTNLRNPDDAFWTTVTAGCLACIPILPKLIVFNPMYLFLFVFPLLVLAARFADHIFLKLREREFVVAVAWLGVVCCLHLPSLASYYLDGSRCNHRVAFNYVQEHWQEGDRLTGYMMGAAEWYIPDCAPRIPLRTVDTVRQLQELANDPESSRLWIVVHSHRGGLDLELRRWLGQNCTYELRVGKKRFDYAEYTVEVFLVKD